MIPQIEEPLPDAGAWAEFFAQQVGSLPILRQSQRKVTEMAQVAGEINIHELADIVIKDPLLTLRTLVTLQQRKKSQSRELTAITSALMMVGLQPFIAQVKSLETVEAALSNDPTALKWLLSRIVRARKAAHFAHDWSLLRRDINAEEVTIAALLFEINEMLLWLFAPKLMQLMLALRKRFPNHPIEVLQRKVFNTTDHELREAVIQRLFLPRILKELMDPANEENPRTKTVLLATRLARHLSKSGWSHPHLPEDIEAIEKLIHLNREALLRRLEVPYEFWPVFGLTPPVTGEIPQPTAKGVTGR
ncbi:hypothetical protein JCM16106_13290 [Hydrogenophilus islandicus]